MLTSSYIHFPRIGTSTEKRIWQSGISTWDEFIENYSIVGLPASKENEILEGIGQSQDRLAASDHSYFAQKLPSNEHWRAYRQFKENTIYLDIETTGLSARNHDITMIGVYRKDETQIFINGINLDEFPSALEGCKTIVTFNGLRFDIPFIQHYFPDIVFDQLHIDLMYPLRRIGLTGGLKKIETSLGLARSTETSGLTGFDAVRLWYQYKRGSQEALDTLIKYNIEDIQNLETIIDTIYPDLVNYLHHS
jgi:uncharacterized protein YprB with RNaseH-like and TPR domain